MFEIIIPRVGNHSASRGEKVYVSYSAKRKVLSVSAGAVRAIGDPPNVYVEYDKDAGKIRVRSATLCDEPGKRKVGHFGVFDTPRLKLMLKEIKSWIEDATTYRVGNDGLFIIDGVHDPENHAVVFDLHNALRVA